MATQPKINWSIWKNSMLLFHNLLIFFWGGNYCPLLVITDNVMAVSQLSVQLSCDFDLAFHGWLSFFRLSGCWLGLQQGYGVSAVFKLGSPGLFPWYMQRAVRGKLCKASSGLDLDVIQWARGLKCPYSKKGAYQDTKICWRCMSTTIYNVGVCNLSVSLLFF